MILYELKENAENEHAFQAFKISDVSEKLQMSKTIFFQFFFYFYFFSRKICSDSRYQI